jgi:hypothetical protein
MRLRNYYNINKSDELAIAVKAQAIQARAKASQTLAWSLLWKIWETTATMPAVTENTFAEKSVRSEIMCSTLFDSTLDLDTSTSLKQAYNGGWVSGELCVDSVTGEGSAADSFSRALRMKTRLPAGQSGE